MEIISLGTEPTVSYPSLSERVQSSFIDAIFIVILMSVAASLLERYGTAPDWIRIALFFGIWGIYEPLCTTAGATIGNYIKGIRVRRVSNTGKRINFLQAFLRYILKMTLGWISFLSMHTNDQRRAIHDLAAGSVMIRR